MRLTITQTSCNSLNAFNNWLATAEKWEYIGGLSDDEKDAVKKIRYGTCAYNRSMISMLIKYL